MILGIVGLPSCGKTTVFNALTGAKIATGTFTAAEDAAHVAMVKVPDPRLDALTRHYNPKKKTHVELKVMDFAPWQKSQAGKGFSAKSLGEMRACDALLLVVRAFEDEAVPHPDDSVDAARDMEALLLELAFADIEVLDRRIERIDASWSRGSKEERVRLEKEKIVIQGVKAKLEKNTMPQDVSLDEEELSAVRNFGLFLEKPLIGVVNIHEDDLGKDMTGPMQAIFPGAPLPLLALAGKIEMEIDGLDQDERQVFLDDLGITEPARDRILRLAWELLGLIVFLTAGEDECRTWAIHRGDNAVTAAGKIHSDLARGFIRAEVTAYSDFEQYGGMQGVKDAGKFHLEGKDYIVKDGDILQIRFNV